MPHKLCRSRFSGDKISKFLTPDILIWYIMKCEVQLINFILVYIIPFCTSHVKFYIILSPSERVLEKNLPQPRTQDRQAVARLL